MNTQLKKSIIELKSWIVTACAGIILFLYYASYNTKVRTLETIHRIEILAERKSAYLEGLSEGLEGFNLKRLEEVLNEQLEVDPSTK